MRKAVVYVEGPSDKMAMRALLRPLLDSKRSQGVEIGFYEPPKGDRKESIISKVPPKAVNIILNDKTAVVVAMPDLYPRDKGFPHESADDLKKGVFKNFDNALRGKDIDNEKSFRERFHVFCFKYDLEALILAAEVALKNRLGIKNLNPTWKIPVEDQNHDMPPKRVVMDLFRAHGKKYVETVDAPVILGSADYKQIAEQCSQCFKPFVEFLEGL
ncbi:MAG: DUF4276 family protein [Nitrospinae bacterium]|nr:DUF4276 family protein [Nitrospinota bacterium]